ncbi:MAG: FtsX-like permease family protein [Gemmatimonadetes bacterium]|nr:FtsX-like permease family protein [Gemmatimonadota bacterium]MXY82653.1 FtsX-like permease family protein [Gemmatimonadota bacterium]MYB71960.1 FtsX-like permease family protein [Gemmatimonadota bacterium]
MLRNYVVIALRNLLRDKVVTSINIVGLSVAIAVSAILGLGVHGALTADWNLREDDRLFRVVTREIQASDGVYRIAYQREDLAAALAETFPEIASTTRVIKTSILMTVGERHLEHSVVKVDPPFLQMFHYPLAAGNPTTALDGLDQVVISKRLAERMFGDEFRDYPELVGRRIVLHGNEGPEPYTVAGVFADLPKKRSLDFDAAIRFENWTKYGANSYWGSPTSTYVTLQPLAERKALEAKLPEFSREFIAPVWERYKGVRWKDDPDAFQLQLQDARDIYLDTQVFNAYEHSEGTKPILALVALIGVILIVACINFTTLAVAGSIGRSAEVGVRKALGANKAQIALQFLGEGVLLALFSLIAGLVLVQLGLPVFNAHYGLDHWAGLSLGDLGLPILVGGGVLLVVLIGIAAGSYPALIVARMQPASVVREVSPWRRRRATSALLTLQYGMAVFLIFCTIAIHQQLAYIQSRDLGHAADQVVVVKLRGADPTQLGERFKEATLSQAGVASVALLHREFPTSTSTNYIRHPDGERITVHQFAVDPDFFTTLGIDLVSGRSFEAGRLVDRTESVVVNQSLADALGWGENAVGEFLPEYGHYGVSKTPTIIGIAPDFHFRSFRESIKPALFHYGPEASFKRALVRLNTYKVDDTLAGLEQIWAKAAPEQPFEYEFLDQTFARQYENDKESSRTVTFASVVAILIACMGLFGHATIVLQRRTKEIGVRKVLGATVAEILALLSRDLTKMVALACLLAFPLAHFLVGQWLSRYAYQFGLGLTTYLLCGTIAFAIALGTVAYIGVRAARENPVHALRYE